MMKSILHIGLCAASLMIVAADLAAQTVGAARPLRATYVVTAADLVLLDNETPGAIQNISDAVGLETKVALYPGRPIHPNDLGPIAVIERNEIIVMIYNQGGLTISTDGRALQRAGIGERIKVMNATSKMIVSATVTESGTVEVGR